MVLSVSTGRQKKPVQDFPVEASEQFLQESLKKGQQKEKSAEILAKEVAHVLATPSTSIPSMNTHFFQGSGTI